MATETGPAPANAAKISFTGNVDLPNWIPVKQEPAFTPRKLKLICAGAGVAGLTLAYKIKHEFKLEDVIDLVIYEKNSEVGGTWYENHYPGLKCDIPSHGFAFLFDPNPDWSHFYASGPEIQAYIRRTVGKWGLDERVQFNSKVQEAIWDETSGKWNITVDQAGAIKNDSCDIFIDGSGPLNKWKWPAIKGLANFKGRVFHTAAWDDSYDWKGKRVAVIGNGASGIQVTAAMAEETSRLVNYIRGPTWITTNFLSEFTKDGSNFEYSETDRKKFREDPDAYYKYRSELLGHLDSFYVGLIVGHPAHEGLLAACKAAIKERLAYNPQLIEKLMPEFSPGCRRLTPGDGYLESFALDHVDICLEGIDEITETGIRTKDGKEEEFDLIVCATGFDNSFLPTYKVVGREGTTLQQRWNGSPEAFFSLHVDGLPNYFMIQGPNAPISHTSYFTVANFEVDYILRWVQKIAKQNIKSIDVKRQSLKDYNVYMQELLKKTAFGQQCRSWYKNGNESGPIFAMYGGSFLHFKECLENIGAEHFHITYNSVNPFGFLGDGQARGEKEGGDKTPTYLAYYEAKRQELETKL